MMRGVVLLAVAAVVAAGPRVRRQVQDCQWFEPCAQENHGAAPDAVAKNNQAEDYKPCNKGQGSCVPYYLCREGTIVTDGAGLIDIRTGLLNGTGGRSSAECPQFLDVCCSTFDTTTIPPPPSYSPKCGTRNSNGIQVRITGFQDQQAQFGEFPWMAAVLRKEIIEDKVVNLYVCGGSLIHPSVVLTAAHCVSSWRAQDLRVRLGEWDTQRTYEPYPHQDRDVVRLVVHPQFKPGPLFNNYALLFLDAPAELTNNVDTICLDSPYSSENCWATGWGTDKFGKSGEFQNVLKKIELSTWRNYECQTALRTTRLSEFFILDDSFLCAGGLTGQDTCKGDGGSPLVCPRSDGRYVQAGIVSWGIGCGEGGIPGVYANLTHSIDWIIGTAESGLREMQQYTPGYWS